MLVTAGQAARVIKRSRETVWSWIRHGKLRPAKRIGKRVLLDLDEVLLVDSRTPRVSPKGTRVSAEVRARLDEVLEQVMRGETWPATVERLEENFYVIPETEWEPWTDS